MRLKLNAITDRTHPLRKVAQEAREERQQRDKVRVERQVDRARVLLVQRCDDRLRDHDWGQAGNEEPVEPVLRQADGGEQRRENMSGDKQGGADTRRAVLVVQLVPERLVQGDEGGFRSIVVGWEVISTCTS